MSGVINTRYYADGSYQAGAAFDPLGVNVGRFDPFVAPTLEPTMSETPALAAGPGTPSGRCAWDGIPILCDQAVALGEGAAVPCPDNDCGPRFTEGRWEPSTPKVGDIRSEGFGIYTTNRYVEESGDDTNPVFAGDGDLVRIGTHPGYWEVLSLPFFPDIASLRRGIPDPQKIRVAYVDQSVLNECTKTLYGVELRLFNETRKGSVGSFVGYGPDSLSNGGYEVLLQQSFLSYNPPSS